MTNQIILALLLIGQFINAQEEQLYNVDDFHITNPLF